MVNGSDQVYIERAGRIEETQTSFLDDAHLLRIIDRIVSQVGRRIDEASPMVDARLPDGSRVNAIIPPLALRGPSLTIRKFARDALTLEHLVGLGTLTEQTAEFLAESVRGKLNILISGGTGTGKTTLLNAVSAHVPPAERVVTIEDAAELRLLQRHVVSLESRPPNVEGEGEIRIRDLVRNALRMRPDRIIVGEVRGAESLDMLQAMNTGHDGSLTTIHANSARDALHRLEMLVLMAGIELPVKAIREQIAGGFDLLVHIGRLVDGSRRITQITEISGMEGDVVTLQDLFVARAPEALERLRAARVAAHDGPSARLPVQAQRQRRRAVALDVAGCRMRKLLLAALALSALVLPAAAAGAESGAVQIRRVDADRFPLVRVTAVVPAGSRPTLAEGGRRAEFVKARELGAAQAMVLAVDNSASMAGRPLREAKRAASAFLSRQNRLPATPLSSRSGTRRCL